jgi:hypothetical protein
MKKTLLVLSLFIAIITVSCQKELNDPSVTAPTSGGSGSGGGGTGGASIVGNWKFVSFSAVTQSTVSYSLAGSTFKSVTISDYTSINNAGTVTITSTTMSNNGVAYDIADTAFATTYIDNVSAGSISSPFSFSLPPTSNTVTYKQVTQDSIYVNPQGSGSTATIGAGYRLALNGNILKMTTTAIQDNTVDAGGITAQQHAVATAVTTLQKQ